MSVISNMQIRNAEAQDCSEIAEIYNHAVIHTTAVWNEVTVDADNRARWLYNHKDNGYPVIVALVDDVVVGFATLSDFRSWDGYRHTVEDSIYVRFDQRGRGIGKALLEELIVRGRNDGFHVIVAGIEAGNESSIKLHEKFRFKRTGVLTEVGTKFGKWLDLAFLQLTLSSH